MYLSLFTQIKLEKVTCVIGQLYKCKATWRNHSLLDGVRPFNEKNKYWFINFLNILECMSIDFLEIRTNIIYSCFLYINAMKITLFINYDFFPSFQTGNYTHIYPYNMETKILPINSFSLLTRKLDIWISLFEIKTKVEKSSLLYWCKRGPLV